MPGRFSLYPDLSVEENLRVLRRGVRHHDRGGVGDDRADLGQLEPFSDRRAGALSGGMKQKLALCCALVHRPEILFLDEPTTGVDAVSRREFWDLLAGLRATGCRSWSPRRTWTKPIRCDRVA